MWILQVDVVVVDDGDNNGQGSRRGDSDDEDDLMIYPEWLDLSSFDDARGAHTSGYCNEFNSGDDYLCYLYVGHQLFVFFVIM